MQIQLGNSFMFFLPDGSCHLTEENPGPINIDFDSLKEEHKNIIKTGLSTGQIVGIDEPEKKKESIDIIKEVYERDNILAGKLQILLKQKIPNIKVEIGKLNDSRALQMLLLLEENNKNRKTITELIKNKLEEINRAVFDSIKDLNIKNINTDQLDPLSRSYKEITDSDFAEVEVTLDEIKR